MQAFWIWIVLLSFLSMACSRLNEETGSVDTGSFPSCSYEEAVNGSCGCNFVSPIDLDVDGGSIELWPFGVHATTGHTEGHRGLDMISTSRAIAVYAPADGVITSISNEQDSSGGLAEEYDLSDPTVRFTTLDADCGVRIVFIPLKLTDGIEAGSRVSQGQLLGYLAELIPPYGPNRWSTHFEVDVKSTDPAYSAVCPAQLVPETQAGGLAEILENSDYSEKSARTVSIRCEDSSTLQIDFPDEDQLCNGRLTQEQRNLLAACTPSKADSIW